MVPRKLVNLTMPQGIIGDHHFAKASSECIGLYRDGYLFSAVMVSQAVAEGIWRFVLERNQIQPKKLKVGGGKKKNRPTIACPLRIDMLSDSTRISFMNYRRQPSE